MNTDDLNKTKKSEQALIESQMMLSLAMQSSRMGAWEHDLATGIINWSAELEEIFGLEQGSFAQTRAAYYELVHEDDRERIRVEVQNAIRENRPYQMEFRFYHADGTVRWMEGRGQAVYSEKGGAIRVYGIGIDITDRQLMENDLRESEKRFRNMADNAPMMVWVTKADGTCIYLSKSWYEFTGQTPETGLEFGWINANHPEDQKSIHEAFATANENRQSFQFEYRLRRKDGKYRWAIDSAQPRFSETGEFSGYIGLVIDITERKSTEEKLRESEDRYRTLFNSIDEGFCIIEVLFDVENKPYDYRFIQANPAMEQLTGLENTIGKTARELIPDLENFWFETYGKVALTGESVRFENRSEPMNSWFDVYASRIGEKNSRRVAIVFNNITERKQTEKILRESELRFRGLQQATPDGFMIFDAVRDESRQIVDFRWVYINPAAEKIVGKNQRDLIGRNLLEIMPGNRDEGLFDAYVAVVETGKLWQKEFQYRHENLDHFFLSTAVKVADGFAVAFSDISARKRIELEREDLLEREKTARHEAEAANRAKDEFLSVLSHELRTPLNSILGWTRMMKSGMLDEIRQKQAVETIERNARLQNNLIEDLLDVSRIISGKMLIEVAEVEFVSVVNAAIETVQTVADGKKIDLEFITQTETLKIFGDETRLQQIVVNLTNNAVKFTPENGNVRLHLTHNRKSLSLQISDNGIGISAEFLPHIFDRFRQADSSTRRNHSGLGLGLTIVSHLTELHGGKISAHSEGKGKGATFTLEIPLDAKNPKLEKEIESSPILNEIISQDSLLQNKSILLVDDDCDGIFPVQMFLEKHGVEVICANTADEALEKLNEKIFDLLISDIGMPKIDGYNLIEKIRTTTTNATIPAIAMTAYASAEDRERALASGYHQHLAKPVDFDRLLHTIINIFQQNEAQ